MYTTVLYTCARELRTWVVSDFVQNEVKWALLFEWLSEVDGLDKDACFTGTSEQVGVQVLGSLSAGHGSCWMGATKTSLVPF